MFCSLVEVEACSRRYGGGLRSIRTIRHRTGDGQLGNVFTPQLVLCTWPTQQKVHMYICYTLQMWSRLVLNVHTYYSVCECTYACTYVHMRICTTTLCIQKYSTHSHIVHTYCEYCLHIQYIRTCTVYI